MRTGYRYIIIFLLIAVLQISACTLQEDENEKIQPVMLEEIEGSDLKRVLLTGRAAERIDLQTESIEEEMVNGVNRLVVPYAAVIYDLHGETWLYTSPSPLIFVRESIAVDYIDEDKAILQAGPSLGTEVVTVGVAELYGAETGVSK